MSILGLNYRFHLRVDEGRAPLDIGRHLATRALEVPLIQRYFESANNPHSVSRSYNRSFLWLLCTLFCPTRKV